MKPEGVPPLAQMEAELAVGWPDPWPGLRHAPAVSYGIDRRASGMGWRGKLTHCKRGHEFTEANTYRKPDGHRNCRRCRADRQRGLLWQW